MSANITNGLCWFRARYGPNHAHNVGTISYAALIVSTREELPSAATYLYGRVASGENGELTVYVTINPARIPNEDAAVILSAVHDQCEGNDVGEMSAAPPILLFDWLSTLFAMNCANEIARMLTLTAFGRDGGSDAPND